MYKFFKILILLVLNFLFVHTLTFSLEEKIKVGLLVPLTGEDKEIGNQIIQSIRIALKDINSSKIEIYPKDTASNPNKTLESAIELKEDGVQIVIGPVFYKNLINLNEVQDLIFVSLTNKTLNLSKNIISAGVNATSQLNAIKKFIDTYEIKKQFF